MANVADRHSARSLLTNSHHAEVAHALTAMHNAGQSERSIHQAAIVLNTTYAWAREQQLTRTNPVLGTELPNGTTITATRNR